MPRALTLLLIALLPIAATLWLRRAERMRPAAGAAECDCGHATAHAHPAVAATPSAPPSVPSPGPGPGAPATDWTTELRARLHAGEAPADLHSTLVELVGRDAPRAMEAVLAIARTPLERHDLAAMTAEIWGAIDAAAAWQWARRESAALDQPDRDPVYAAVLNGVASQRPESVASLADAALAASADGGPPWPAPQLTQAAVAALLKSAAYEIAGQALARWQRELAPAQLDPTPFAMLATAWSSQAPAEAATWLLTLPDSAHRARGLGSLAANWAESAPAAALDWAAALPPQTGRDTILARAFERWVDQDSLAAAQWLGHHESEPATDRMIHTLLTTSTIASAHPREAVQWAELIDAPELRLEALKNALSFWAQADGPAARSFVTANARLTAEQKAALLTALPRPHAITE